MLSYQPYSLYILISYLFVRYLLVLLSL